MSVGGELFQLAHVTKSHTHLDMASCTFKFRQFSASHYPCCLDKMLFPIILLLSTFQQRHIVFSQIPCLSGSIISFLFGSRVGKREFGNVIRTEIYFRLFLLFIVIIDLWIVNFPYMMLIVEMLASLTSLNNSK